MEEEVHVIKLVIEHFDVGSVFVLIQRVTCFVIHEEFG